MPDAPAPEYLGAADVCRELGIDRSTLSRWIKDGTAHPAMRLPGKTGAYLFTPAEVARLTKARAPRAAAP